MHGRAIAAFVAALVFGLTAFAACHDAQAATPMDSAITIAGNRHVDAAMIRAYFHANRNGQLDAAALDAALKSLYGSGLFRDVKLSRDGGGIVVSVVENPTIEKTALD